jgi:hypothetical protein
VNCRCAHGGSLHLQFHEAEAFADTVHGSNRCILEWANFLKQGRQILQRTEKSTTLTAVHGISLVHQLYLARDIKRKISNEDLLLINGCNSSAHDGTDFWLQSLSK